MPDGLYRWFSSEKEIKYIKEIIFLKKEILLYYLEWIHDIGIESSNLDHREMASGIVVLTAIIDVLPSGGGSTILRLLGENKGKI